MIKAYRPGNLAPLFLAALLCGVGSPQRGAYGEEPMLGTFPADPSQCSILVNRPPEVATRSIRPRQAASIQDAVDAARPGDLVCVLSHDHTDERVSVTSSGTPNEPIRIRAIGAVRTAGFVVEADHVAIEGFIVSNRGKSDGQGRSMGIFLAGTGLRVIDNTVIDTEGDGIGCDTYPASCNDVVIARNTVRGADGAGILVAGHQIRVERNDVARSVMINASDADGIRFFGSEIVIRGNYVHDISDRGYPQGEEPHTDCFQTFDNSKPPTTSVVIEGNVCENVDHQCLIAAASEVKRSAVIKFRNNLCNNNGSQGVLLQNFPFVEVTNNLFLPSIRYFGVAVRSGSIKATIANNVFVGAFRPYDVDDASRPGLRADYNLVYDKSQLTPPVWWTEANGQWGVDPGFVGAAVAGASCGYSPTSSSPLVDAGDDEYGSSATDLVGNPRVADGDGDGRTAIDIGPFELVKRVESEH